MENIDLASNGLYRHIAYPCWEMWVFWHIDLWGNMALSIMGLLSVVSLCVPFDVVLGALSVDRGLCVFFVDLLSCDYVEVMGKSEYKPRSI